MARESTTQWNIITERDVSAALEEPAPPSAPPAPSPEDDAVVRPPQPPSPSGGGTPAPAPPGPPPPPAGTPKADDFWNRLMKGIPLPVIGGYLATADILNSVTDDESQGAREIVFWLVYLFFGVITPLFARRVLGVIRRRQLVLSTVAFLLWGFALGGPFDISFAWWAPWIGGIAVICSAVLLMVIEPASARDDPVPVPIPGPA